jgi:hypothetical protein
MLAVKMPFSCHPEAGLEISWRGGFRMMLIDEIHKVSSLLVE